MMMIPNPDLEYDPEALPIIPEKLFHESVSEFAAILADTSNPIRSTEAYTPVVEVRGMTRPLASVNGLVQ